MFFLIYTYYFIFYCQTCIHMLLTSFGHKQYKQSVRLYHRPAVYIQRPAATDNHCQKFWDELALLVLLRTR